MFIITGLDLWVLAVVGLGNALYQWIVVKWTYRSGNALALVALLLFGLMLLVSLPFRWLQDVTVFLTPGWLPVLVLAVVLAAVWLWRDKAAERAPSQRRW